MKTMRPGEDAVSSRSPFPTAGQLRLDHLRALTGRFGLFEHARQDVPRVSHGYTTDDNARALAVLGDAGLGTSDQAERYLRFVLWARVPGGWHNRLSPNGAWLDDRGSDDAHGRALWGLGTLIAAGVTDREVESVFLSGLDLATSHPRANCYAVIGATAALRTGSFTAELERFIDRVANRLPRRSARGWAWPEPRLTYDNARLPQALILAGAALGDDGMTEHGLSLLAWLIDTERGRRGFSFTPVGGKGPGESGPAFDQQPIEAWGMADAALAAAAADPGGPWLEAVADAAAWFLGRNDVGVALYDRSTGGGFDGLEAAGVNRNRGAESTLAALAALHAGALARSLVAA
jgi:hypothetical protein